MKITIDATVILPPECADTEDPKVAEEFLWALEQRLSSFLFWAGYSAEAATLANVEVRQA